MTRSEVKAEERWGNAGTVELSPAPGAPHPTTCARLGSLRSWTERRKGTGSWEGFSPKWRGRSLARVDQETQNDNPPPLPRPTHPDQSPLQEGVRENAKRQDSTSQEPGPQRGWRGGALSAVLKVLRGREIIVPGDWRLTACQHFSKAETALEPRKGGQVEQAT